MSQSAGLLCSVCSEYRKKTEYSKKQLKAKGKRKCGDCIEAEASVQNLSAQTSHEVKSQFLKEFQSEGSSTVKKVLANEVMSVQTKNTKANAPLLPAQDKYDVLIKWLIDGGAKFPKLYLRYYTVDYRGVHCKARMEPDETILEVPLKLLMTSEVAKESAIGRRIEESNCQLRSAHSWLACFLLQEKYNPDSFWKPYIDTLPKHYRNMPIFFDKEELKELEGSLSLEMTTDRKISLKLEYDNIIKHIPEFAKYHHLDFFWARLAVITRIFGFEIGNLKTDGLVAMADMLNHKRPNESSWTYDNSKGAFTITTTKKLLKGAQVFDSYGRKCNSRYFVNYGFALDENEDNQTALYFQIPAPSDDSSQEEKSLYSVKSQLVGTSQRRFQIPFEHKEKVTKKCVSYLRICFATLEELVQIKKENKSYEIIKPVSVENEYKVMMAIASASNNTLNGFKTSVDEDNKLLQRDDLTMNVRNCIIMRRGEKEVCEAYIDLARKLQQVRGMDLRQTRKYCAQHVNNKGPKPSFAWRTEKYFEEFWLPVMETGDMMPDLEEMNNSLGE